MGGTILHVLRLIYNPQIADMPSEIDWFVVIIGSYGGVGLLVFARQLMLKNIWDKTAYALLVFHLIGSVILHAYMLIVGNHNTLNIFPYWYSFIAVGYFIALGLYVINLNKRLYRTTS